MILYRVELKGNPKCLSCVNADTHHIITVYDESKYTTLYTYNINYKKKTCTYIGDIEPSTSWVVFVIQNQVWYSSEPMFVCYTEEAIHCFNLIMQYRLLSRLAASKSVHFNSHSSQHFSNHKLENGFAKRKKKCHTLGS